MPRCITCGRLPKRSSAANARYWKLLSVISETYRPEGAAFSTDTWHLQCRKYWLGCEDLKMPDGTTMPFPKSTAGLDVAEFNDYMTAVEAWANMRGVFLDE